MSAALGDGSHRININNGLLLYHHHYSYYSQKVLMALHEKNLPFESHVINLAKGAQYEPWFLKLNPRGEVPVLQDTGKIIPDSVRIIDYLEDNFSNGDTPRLIPIDQGAEIKKKIVHFRYIIDQIPARILTMGSFVHSDLVGRPKPPFIGPVRRLLRNAERNIGNVLRELAESNPEAKEILLQKARTAEQKSNIITNKDEYVNILVQVDEVLNSVENELANHTDDKQGWWLCSDRFTVADISLTILLERLNQLGYECRFWKNGKRPRVEKYYTRAKQRESYEKTIPNMFFHVKMFVSTYQKPLIIGIAAVATISVVIGGVFLVKNWSK